jgi:putative membrane protein
LFNKQGAGIVEQGEHMEMNEEDSGVDPRIYFAAERTLLAWVRTGLAMMGFGFVLARFGLFLRVLASDRHAPPHQPSGLSLGLGIALVILGVLANAYAAIRHYHTVRRLEQGQKIRFSPLSPGTWAAGFLAILGIATAVYLLLGLSENH